MKIILLALSLIIALTGCTSNTEHGRCIGAFSDKDPNLTYELSTWNVVIAVVFAELVVPPVIVVADKTLCPVGKKQVTP